MKTNHLASYKTILSKKSVVNYVIIHVIIIVFLLLLLGAREYCNREVDYLINSETNRTITLFINENQKEIKKFLLDKKMYIENVNYNIVIDEMQLEIGNFKLQSNYSDSFNNDNIYSVIINNKNIKIIKISDLFINNILYSDEIDDQTIIINQLMAQYLFNNHEKAFGNVSFEVIHYSKMEELISDLTNNYIEAASDSSLTTTIEMNVRILNVVNSLFFIMGILIIITLVFLNVNIIYEQRRNIKIYDFIGYDCGKILTIYIFIFFKILFYVYSLIIIVLLIGTLLLDKLINLDLYSLFIKIFGLPLIIIIFINGAILIPGIIATINKERKLL